MPFDERKLAYEADITYGTNSEFGFDYLRDNMAISLEGLVQRGHAYAIVDEVDSILIDEARTPLIISGEPTTAAKTYYDFARVVRGLRGVQSKDTEGRGPGARSASTTTSTTRSTRRSRRRESGIEKVERALKIEHLYDPRNIQLVNHLIQALKAESLYKRDVDYVIQDGEVKIVDEFTGRIMEGRRWSEGLHQAVEAKEGVPIQEEHQTLATITLQNYFRLYDKLAGMTGTAKTEEKEFVEIYDLNVVPIPTNVAVARDDNNDLIFKTKDAKFDAVVQDIKERHEKGQPVLVGTIAVETSEYLQRAAQAPGRPAQRPQREGARARGRDHQGRRPGRRRHDRDEHGRPRRRHQDRRQGARARRPLRPRHRAPRVAADRQPAPRPLGPPGRPGRDALLPLRPGRPRPPVRRRPDLQHHGALQAAGRPADGGEHPLEPDRERAEEGRGAELRRAEERPQVRRRHERPASRDLRAAPRRARGPGPVRGDQGAVDPRGDLDTSSASTPRRATRRSGTSRGSWPRWSSSTAPASTAEELRGLDRDAIVEEFLDDALDAYAERERESRACRRA